MCEFIIDQQNSQLSDWVLVGVTIVLAIATIGLVIYTKFLYDESKMTRLQNITPQISVILYPLTTTFFYFQIKNTGNVDAKNVRVQCLNNNIYKFKNHQFFYSDKLSKTYSYLAAGQSYTYKLGYYFPMKNEKFLFDISFTNVSNDITPPSYSFEIDMSEIDHSIFKQNYLHGIYNNLSEISNLLKSIVETSPAKSIRVFNFTPKDKKEHDEKLIAELNSREFEESTK